MAYDWRKVAALLSVTGACVVGVIATADTSALWGLFALVILVFAYNFRNPKYELQGETLVLVGIGFVVAVAVWVTKDPAAMSALSFAPLLAVCVNVFDLGSVPKKDRSPK